MDSGGSSSKDAAEAKRRWEAANGVEEVNGLDARYTYDGEKIAGLLKKHPWKSDPHYFKRVHISALALIKIVLHAKSGGEIEVMGSLIGKFEDQEFIVMDSFPLPVEGTTVRVEADSSGQAFQVEFLKLGQKAERPEHSIGWYHSHPDYGCWLSGVDVETQQNHQKHNEPWLAIVVDPIRTMSSGKVDIGAFRTYPEEYQPKKDMPNEHQVIPSEKIQDYGHHYWKYYPLEMSCFKSHLEASLLETVWNRFWASTLSTSPLLENRTQVVRQIEDLSTKIKNLIDRDPQQSSRGYVWPSTPTEDSDMMQIMAESQKTANEQMRGLMTLMVKNSLFNS